MARPELNCRAMDVGINMRFFWVKKSEEDIVKKSFNEVNGINMMLCSIQKENFKAKSNILFISSSTLKTTASQLTSFYFSLYLSCITKLLIEKEVLWQKITRHIIFNRF